MADKPVNPLTPILGNNMLLVVKAAPITHSFGLVSPLLKVDLSIARWNRISMVRDNLMNQRRNEIEKALEHQNRYDSYFNVNAKVMDIAKLFYHELLTNSLNMKNEQYRQQLMNFFGYILGRASPSGELYPFFKDNLNKLPIEIELKTGALSPLNERVIEDLIASNYYNMVTRNGVGNSKPRLMRAMKNLELAKKEIADEKEINAADNLLNLDRLKKNMLQAETSILLLSGMVQDEEDCIEAMKYIGNPYSTDRLFVSDQSLRELRTFCFAGYREFDD